MLYSVSNLGTDTDSGLV